MKIGITGGVGNISKYITEYLLEKDNEVFIFNHKEIKDARFNGAKGIVCDRYDMDDFKTKVEPLGQFDCIIDMICFTPEHAKIAIDTFRNKTKHMIFCSTVDVYTKDPKNYPITESFEKMPSKSFTYAYEKAICEKMFKQAASEGAFELSVLRPAATYSEGGSPLVHAFRGGSYHLDRIRKGKKIIMHGDGASIWTSTHASDVAKAFANAVCNEKAYGKEYNVMGNEFYSYKRYFDIMAEAMGAPPIEYVYLTTDIMNKIMPDIAEWCEENFKYNNIFDNNGSIKDLGFEYSITWFEGAKRCIEYLDANAGLENSDDEKYKFYDKLIGLYEKHQVQMIKEFQE